MALSLFVCPSWLCNRQLLFCYCRMFFFWTAESVSLHWNETLKNRQHWWFFSLMSDLYQVCLIVRVVVFPQLISQLEQGCKLNLLSVLSAMLIKALLLKSVVWPPIFVCDLLTIYCVSIKMKILLKEKPKTLSISNKPEVRSYRLWEKEACNNFKIKFHFVVN